MCFIKVYRLLFHHLGTCKFADILALLKSLKSHKTLAIKWKRLWGMQTVFLFLMWRFSPKCFLSFQRQRFSTRSKLISSWFMLCANQRPKAGSFPLFFDWFTCNLTVTFGAPVRHYLTACCYLSIRIFTPVLLLELFWFEDHWMLM